MKIRPLSDHHINDIKQIQSHIDDRHQKIDAELNSKIISIYTNSESYLKSNKLWRAFFYVAAFITPEKAANYALDKIQAKLSNYLMLFTDREESLQQQKAVEYHNVSLLNTIRPLKELNLNAENPSLQERMDSLKAEVSEFISTYDNINAEILSKWIKSGTIYEEHNKIKERSKDFIFQAQQLQSLDYATSSINNEIRSLESRKEFLEKQINDWESEKRDYNTQLGIKQNIMNDVISQKLEKGGYKVSADNLALQIKAKQDEIKIKEMELNALEETFALYDTLISSIKLTPDRTKRQKVESELRTLKNSLINIENKHKEAIENFNQISEPELENVAAETAEIEQKIEELDRLIDINQELVNSINISIKENREKLENLFQS